MENTKIKEEKHIHRSKKKQSLNHKLQEIENLNRDHEYRKNSEGDLPISRSEDLVRWVEHFSTLLNNKQQTQEEEEKEREQLNYEEMKQNKTRR